MRISVLFQSAHATAKQEVLIDSRATDNFISPQLLKWLGISTLPVKLPIHIWNIDGTHNQGGAITHNINLEVRTGEQKKMLRFLITNLGRDEVILGYPWFTAFEPKFHWQDTTLDKEFHPFIVSSLGLKHPYHPLESTICKTTTATSLAQQVAGITKPKCCVTVGTFARLGLSHFTKTLGSRVLSLSTKSEEDLESFWWQVVTA